MSPSSQASYGALTDDDNSSTKAPAISDSDTMVDNGSAVKMHPLDPASYDIDGASNGQENELHPRGIFMSGFLRWCSQFRALLLKNAKTFRFRWKMSLLLVLAPTLAVALCWIIMAASIAANKPTLFPSGNPYPDYDQPFRVPAELGPCATFDRDGNPVPGSEKSCLGVIFAPARDNDTATRAIMARAAKAMSIGDFSTETHGFETTEQMLTWMYKNPGRADYAISFEDTVQSPALCNGPVYRPVTTNQGIGTQAFGFAATEADYADLCGNNQAATPLPNQPLTQQQVMAEDYQQKVAVLAAGTNTTVTFGDTNGQFFFGFNADELGSALHDELIVTVEGMTLAQNNVIRVWTEIQQSSEPLPPSFMNATTAYQNVCTPGRQQCNFWPFQSPVIANETDPNSPVTTVMVVSQIGYTQSSQFSEDFTNMVFSFNNPSSVARNVTVRIQRSIVPLAAYHRYAIMTNTSSSDFHNSHNWRQTSGPYGGITGCTYGTLCYADNLYARHGMDPVFEKQATPGRLFTLKKAIDESIIQQRYQQTKGTQEEADVQLDISLAGWTALHGDFEPVAERIATTTINSQPMNARPVLPASNCTAVGISPACCVKNRGQKYDTAERLVPLCFIGMALLMTVVCMQWLAAEKHSGCVGQLRRLGGMESAMLGSWFVSWLLVALTGTLIAVGLAKTIPGDVLLFEFATFGALFVPVFLFVLSMLVTGMFLSTLASRPKFSNALSVLFFVVVLVLVVLFQVLGGATNTLKTVKFDANINGIQSNTHVCGVSEWSSANFMFQNGGTTLRFFAQFPWAKFLLAIQTMQTYTQYGVEFGIDDFGLSFTKWDSKSLNDGNLRYTSASSPTIDSFVSSSFVWMAIFGTVLLWYLSQVLAGAKGAAKPWDFPFHGSFWGLTSQDPVFLLDGDILSAEQLKSRDDRSILLHKVSKHFKGGGTALKEVSLTMKNNEVTALLGHNGAGKSTLINILSGLTPASFGNAFVQGMEPTYAQQFISTCAQDDILFDELTILDQMRLTCAMKGIRGAGVEALCTALLRDVDLVPNAKHLVSTLSGGMKRRVSVALTALAARHDRVLFFDEPTTGMDPVNRRRVWRLISRLKQDRVVILTTHSMEEADSLGDTIAILDSGKLRALGSSLFLKTHFGSGYQVTLIAGRPEDVPALRQLVVESLPGADIVTAGEKSGHLQLALPKAGLTKLPAFFRLLKQHQADEANQVEGEEPVKLLKEWGISNTTLEEVFVRICAEKDELTEAGVGTSQERSDRDLLYKEFFGFSLEFAEQLDSNIHRHQEQVQLDQPVRQDRQDLFEAYQRSGKSLRSNLKAVTDPEVRAELERAKLQDQSIDEDDILADDVVVGELGAFDMGGNRESQGLLDSDDVPLREDAAIEVKDTASQPLSKHRGLLQILAVFRKNSQIQWRQKKTNIGLFLWYLTCVLLGNLLPSDMATKNDDLKVECPNGWVLPDQGASAAYICQQVDAENVGSTLSQCIESCMAFDDKGLNCDVNKCDALFSGPNGVEMWYLNRNQLMKATLGTYAYGWASDGEFVRSRADNVQPQANYGHWFGVNNDFAYSWVNQLNDNECGQSQGFDFITSESNANKSFCLAAGPLAVASVWESLERVNDQSQNQGLMMVDFENITSAADGIDMNEFILRSQKRMQSEGLPADGPGFSCSAGRRGNYESNCFTSPSVVLVDNTLKWLEESRGLFPNSRRAFDVGPHTVNQNRSVFILDVTLRYRADMVGANWLNKIVHNDALHTALVTLSYSDNGYTTISGLPYPNVFYPHFGDDVWARACSSVNVQPNNPTGDDAGCGLNQAWTIDATINGVKNTIPVTASPMTLSGINNGRLQTVSHTDDAIVSLATVTNAALCEIVGCGADKVTTDANPNKFESIHTLVSPMPHITWGKKGQPIPGPEYLHTYYTMMILFPMVLAVTILFPTQVHRTVNERSTRLVEMMQIAGVRHVNYWVGNYLFDTAFASICGVFFVLIAMGIGVWWAPSDKFGWYLLLVLGWGHAQSCLSVAVSAFFGSSKSSSKFSLLVSAFAIVASSVAAVFVNNAFDSSEMSPLLMLILPFAFVRAAHLVILRGIVDNAATQQLATAFAILFLVSWVYLLFGIILNSMRADLDLSWLAFWKHCSSKSKDQANNNPSASLLVDSSLGGALVGGEDSDVAAERRRVQKFAETGAGSGVRLMDLRKVYPSRGKKAATLAVQDLTLGCDLGEIFGLLGPNGAGKTTALSIVAGVLGRSAGRVWIGGEEISDGQGMRASSYEAKNRLGICPQFDVVWDDLTVHQHLMFYSAVKGIPAAVASSVIQKLAAETGLDGDSLHKPAGTLSGGQRRRLSFAVALIGRPPVLLCDEPSTGLDPLTRKDLWTLIRSQANQDRLIIITTHSMEEADTLCDRIGIMASGQLRCVGQPLQLKNKFAAGFTLTVSFTKKAMEVLSAQSQGFDEIDSLILQTLAEKHPQARVIRSAARNRKYTLPETISVDRVFRVLEAKQNKRRFGIRDWGLTQSSLEEVFVKIAGDIDDNLPQQTRSE